MENRYDSISILGLENTVVNTPLLLSYVLFKLELPRVIIKFMFFAFFFSWSNKTQKPLTSSRSSAAAVSAYGELYIVGGYQVPNINGTMAR
jgi:hypothetical protein